MGVDALGPTRCPQSATSVHDLNFSSATPKLTRFPPTEIMESRTLPFRPPGPNDADGELSPDSSAMTRLTPDSDSNSGSDSENDSDLDLDMGEVGESFKMQRRGRDVEKGGVGDKEGLNDQDDEEDDYTTTGRRRAASISTVHSYQLYTPDEERAVVRKFDRKLVLFVALLYMLSFLDRSNIGNAKIAGLDLDLDLDSPRYEWVITAFYIAYICFEWMSVLWKIVPAHIYVTVIVLSWGIVASLQSVATSFASTLAWAIVKLGSNGPIAPWRLLFLLEGFPSVLVAVIAWHTIPDSPDSAHYLTRREKKVARLRLRKDKDPKSALGKGLNLREMLATIVDPKSYLTAFMFFFTNMAFSSMPVFLPTIIHEMGHTVLISQALSAPPYLMSFFVVILTAYLSDRLRNRSYFVIFHALLSA